MGGQPLATKKDWIYKCLPVPCFTLTSHVVCVSINLLNNLVDKNCYCFFHAKPLLNCNFDACICQMRMFYSRKAVLNHKLCTQKEFIILKRCGYGSRLPSAKKLCHLSGSKPETKLNWTELTLNCLAVSGS